MKNTFKIKLGLLFLLFSFISWKTISPVFQKNHKDVTNFKNKIFEADSNKLYCPDDMEVTLWAESPMLYNPTNMDVDIKGRIWVTEAVNYRDFNKKPDMSRAHHDAGERVVILEDTDQDGKADKSTVFVEDKELISPLGIAVVGNKVYVSAAPNLFVYTDENGDDKADKREIFLTGFGGKDHDHSLHSGVMAPDGQFFFNVGNAGPHIVTDKAGWTLRSGSLYYGGTPYNLENHGNQKSDDGRVWVGGLAMKIGKDGKGLKVLGHNFRNSYEVAMDSHGNMWQNDNDDQVIACRTSFVIENGQAGYFSNDGTRTWQADRRPDQDIFTGSWHLEDPGFMPEHDNTGSGSPTGIHMYEGDAFGDKYRGMLLSAEAGRNVIFNYFPKANGAGFELKRNDLISSQGSVSSEKYDWYATGQDKRKWFRPSDVCAGTDGAIYIADWYDPIVGGHAMHDNVAFGRIYRVTPKNKKITNPKIDISTEAGQIQAFSSAAQNVRFAGFEALLAKGEQAIPALVKLVNGQNPFIKSRAIWLMAQLGEKGYQEVENILIDSQEQTRLVAFRALRGQSKNLVSLCEKMANDESAAVRREVAIALRDVPFENSKNAITSLMKGFDGQDAWLLEAIGTACDSKESKAYELMKTLNLSIGSKNKITWCLHPTNAVADIKNTILDPSSSEKTRKMMLVALGYIKDKSAALAMISLTKSALKDVETQARYWVNFRKTNEWASFMNWEAVANEIMTPNMRKMMAYKDKLFDKKVPQNEKIKIAKLMAKDTDGGNLLINMKAGYELDEDLTKAVGEDLFNNSNAQVRILASQFFPRNGEPVKLDYVTRMPGDNEKGKVSFATNCATCHRHGENGNDIGPDLTNIHKKYDKLSLLDAIVNPSASMVFGFESYSISTNKGKNYFGFLIGDDGKNLTIKDAAGNKSVIKIASIKKKVKMATSLMPDPIAMGLKEQELADLSSYLMSFK